MLKHPAETLGRMVRASDVLDQEQFKSELKSLDDTEELDQEVKKAGLTWTWSVLRTTRTWLG